MDVCLIKDGVKYISISEKNYLKKTSLEANVYFILNDIYVHTYDDYDSIPAMNLMEELAGKSNKDKSCIKEPFKFDKWYIDENFKYTNVLRNRDKTFIKKLYDFLSSIEKDDQRYDFSEPEIYEIKTHDFDFSRERYMKFDLWWEELQELCSKIEIMYYFSYK